MYLKKDLNECNFCNYTFVSDEELKIIVNESKPNKVKYINLVLIMISEVVA